MILELLILSHMIGDFWFQTKRINKMKGENIYYLLLHVGLYMVPITATLIIIELWFWRIIFFTLIAIAHLLIDLGKIWLDKQKKIPMLMSFFLDQTLHIAIIGVLVSLNKSNVYSINAFDLWLKTFNPSITAYAAIMGAILIILLTKPTSIVIELVMKSFMKQRKIIIQTKALLLSFENLEISDFIINKGMVISQAVNNRILCIKNKYKLSDAQLNVIIEFVLAENQIDLMTYRIEAIIEQFRFSSEDSIAKIYEDLQLFNRLDKNIGEIIGVLERIVIVTLCALGLWTSVVLVFTAKSIARFKQLEEKDFAQKYLIGTLLSMCITLILLFLYVNIVL